MRNPVRETGQLNSSATIRILSPKALLPAVYIQEVTGTNAKKAGFQSGDLVYAVDGTKITSFNTLSSIVTSHKVGDKLTYTIVRGNQTKEIKLTLEEKKASN